MTETSPKKARGLARYSRDNSLVRLDRRTREGRFAAAVEAELLEHCAPPSATQRIIVRLAALKALRCAMMADFVLSANSISERDDRQFLSWANSLRRDLETLGLTRIESQSPTLAAYIDLQRAVAS